MADMPGDLFRLQLKFWGVRGSTPTPGFEYLGYGGNTTCLEIQGGDHERIVIDAGSGIRKLGQQLLAEKPEQKLDLFLTHFHWDHIQGLPFFAPLLADGNQVTFHSFPSAEEIRSRLERQMSAPYFTLDFNAVQAKREFVQLQREQGQGSLNIVTFPLHHPQGACGFRVEASGAVIVIATDVEHGDPVLDRVLRENSEGADLLVYDAQYTPAEYTHRLGWGHSTYAAAAAVAKDARVGKLILFHHDPTHEDARMGTLIHEAEELFENTTAARELDTIIL